MANFVEGRLCQINLGKSTPYAAQPHAPQENVDQEQRERGQQDGRPQRLAGLAAVAARVQRGAHVGHQPPAGARRRRRQQRRPLLAAGGGRSSGANGSVIRPLAAAIGVPPAASRPVNSSAPDSMSGRKLAS